MGSWGGIPPPPDFKYRSSKPPHDVVFIPSIRPAVLLVIITVAFVAGLLCGTEGIW